MGIENIIELYEGLFFFEMIIKLGLKYALCWFEFLCFPLLLVQPPDVSKTDRSHFHHAALLLSGKASRIRCLSSPAFKDYTAINKIVSFLANVAFYGLFFHCNCELNIIYHCNGIAAYNVLWPQTSSEVNLIEFYILSKASLV